MATARGGDRITQRLAEIASRLGGPSGVKVGFMAGSTTADGKSLPMVAAINEFGAPSRGIPPRPFMRQTIAAHKAEWPAATAALLRKHDMDVRGALGEAGEAIKGQIQAMIVQGDFVPNAPSTVRRKGFDRPLIDTGHMLNSVAVELVEGED